MDDATYNKARDLRKQIRHIEMTSNEMIKELEFIGMKYQDIPSTFVAGTITMLIEWTNNETRGLREAYEKI